MKALTLVIWFCWAAICARVLAAPVAHLSLQEGLFLFVVCAPAVGAMTWVRWLLRQKPEPTPSARAEASERERRGVVGQLF